MLTKTIVFNCLIGACMYSASAYAEQHVDCSTAESDIAHLKHEKKSTDERVAKGVFSIMPIGIALNAMQKAGEDDAKEMETKEYSKQLDARIAEIKSTCGIK